MPLGGILRAILCAELIFICVQQLAMFKNDKEKWLEFKIFGFFFFFFCYNRLAVSNRSFLAS